MFSKRIFRSARVFRRAVICAAAAAVALAALLSCDSGATSPGDEDLGCADLSKKYFRDSIGDGFYRVLSPNGGESYVVGDSLSVRFTSGLNDSEAVVFLSITRNGITYSVIVPGSPSGNIDPRSRCSLGFRIPDSLRSTSGRKIPVTTDSARIRIAKYNFESISDYSDGFFRIKDAMP